jgi:hypothetical protein
MFRWLWHNSLNFVRLSTIFNKDAHESQDLHAHTLLHTTRRSAAYSGSGSADYVNIWIFFTNTTWHSDPIIMAINTKFSFAAQFLIFRIDTWCIILVTEIISKIRRHRTIYITSCWNQLLSTGWSVPDENCALCNQWHHMQTFCQILVSNSDNSKFLNTSNCTPLCKSRRLIFSQYYGRIHKYKSTYDDSLRSFNVFTIYCMWWNQALSR